MGEIIKDKKYGAPFSSKKEMIASLWAEGSHDIWKLAKTTATRPSYVAAVLQNAGLLKGYFDLYTSSTQDMNVYSQLFRGIMGFKNEATAMRSMKWIHRMYCEFGEMGDRAGQHHALVTALTMYDRARWSNKRREADIFRRWLMSRLNENEEFLPVRSVSAPPTRTKVSKVGKKTISGPNDPNIVQN